MTPEQEDIINRIHPLTMEEVKQLVEAYDKFRQVEKLKLQELHACKDCKWKKHTVITLEEIRFDYKDGWTHKTKECTPYYTNKNGLCPDFKPKMLVRFFDWLKGLANGNR